MASAKRTELEGLAERIKAMSPADKLRLAAGLLEAQRPEMAHTIAQGAVVELGAALCLREARRGG